MTSTSLPRAQRVDSTLNPSNSPELRYQHPYHLPGVHEHHHGSYVSPNRGGGSAQQAAPPFAPVQNSAHFHQNGAAYARVEHPPYQSVPTLPHPASSLHQTQNIQPFVVGRPQLRSPSDSDRDTPVAVHNPHYSNPDFNRTAALSPYTRTYNINNNHSLHEAPLTNLPNMSYNSHTAATSSFKPVPVQPAPPTPGPSPQHSPWSSTEYHDKSSLYQQSEVKQPKPNITANVKTEAFSPVSRVDRNKRAYACPKCPKVFKRGDHVKRHLLSVHDRDHPYQCGECPKGFATVDSLIKHNHSSHGDTNSKNHLCVRCGIRFEYIQELVAHASSLHEAQDIEYMKGINKNCKTFSCTICQKTVTSEKNLKRHIEKVHGDQKVACQTCSITFKCASELQHHNLQVHVQHSNADADLNNLPVERKPHTAVSSAPNLPTTAPSANQKMSLVQGTNIYHNQIDDKQYIAQQNQPTHDSIPSSNLLSSSHHQQQYMPYASQHIPRHPMHSPHNLQQSLHLHNLGEPPSAPQRESNVPPPVHQQVDKLSQIVPTTSMQVSASDTSQAVSKPQVVVLVHKKKDEETNIQVGQPLSTLDTHNNETNVSAFREANTVSEAFSMAMKTLSDFSYDDLSLPTGEYLPVGLSTFQSSSPLPNFHHPSSVQLAEPGTAESPVVFTNCQTPTSQAAFVAASYSDTHAGHAQSPYSNEVYDTTNVGSPAQSKLNMKKSMQVNSQAGGKVVDSIPIQARRGRPKKKRKRGDDDDDEDDYGAQSMILKEFDDGNTIKFNCTVCNESYVGIDNLMQHVESVHLSANPHECCICKKRFAQAGNVKRHIRFVHLRERPFRCRDCESTFDRLCYLQRHMRSHVDTQVNNPETSHLNPCNCPECGKRCLTAHHLRGHMQRKHFAKNKERSNDLVRKYGHLFAGSDGFKTISDVKLDQFGRPVKPSRRKQKMPKSYSDKTGTVNQPSGGPYNYSFNGIDHGNAINQNTLPNSNFNGPQISNTKFQKSSNQSSDINECEVNGVSRDHATPDSTKRSPQLESLLQSDSNRPSALNSVYGLLNQTATHENTTVLQTHISSDLKKESSNHSHASSSSNGQFSNRSAKRSSKYNFCMYKNRGRFSKQTRRSYMQYKCQHCPNRSFPSLSLLKSHIAIIHHSTTHRHLCLLCGRSYSSKGLLVAHVSKQHTNIKTAIAPRKKKFISVPAVAKGSFVMQHPGVEFDQNSMDPAKMEVVDTAVHTHNRLQVQGEYSVQHNCQEQLYNKVTHVPSHSLLQT